MGRGEVLRIEGWVMLVGGGGRFLRVVLDPEMKSFHHISEKEKPGKIKIQAG